MKNVQALRKTGKSVNSACNVVNLQSTSRETVHEPVRDSDLIIDINSDVQSCMDDQKSFLSSTYNLEDDIEKLIEVSKQFQEDYENERVRNVDSVEVDRKLNIQVLSSRSSSLLSRPTPTFEANQQDNDVDNYYFSDCSSRSKKENIFSVGSRPNNKTFTPKIPKAGPFGTGIIRPSPKKHSCVQKKELVKGSCRVAWKIRPYSARYYNFDRTHPHLQLIENGDTIIPKRILKRTTQMTEKLISKAIKKPLLNEGLTWHEFFERSNVYSAKSLQSSYGDCQTHTTSTQTGSSTPTSNQNIKIQKHVLPQLNIRAECSVQRIPEISIAPNALQHIIKSNIKLVEIIYGESDDSNKKVVDPMKECIDSKKKDKRKIVDEQHYPSESGYTPPTEIEINENTQITESKVSFTTSSNTSLNNHGYDSSLEESISLNVSRVSAVTDYEAGRRLLPDSSIQNQKVRKFAKRRKDTNVEQVEISSSDCIDFEYDGKHPIEPQQVYHGDVMSTNLPTFPTNELIRMVDEIFDTSSDGCSEKNVVNLNYKNVLKETSVQTDIVWENINEFLRQQGKTIGAPTSGAVENNLSDNFARPDEPLISNVPKTKEVEDHRFVNATPPQATNPDIDILLHRDVVARSKVYCRHSHMKKFKICSCLHCKNNIQFSVMNINQSSPSKYVTSSGSSSSAVVEITKAKSSGKTNLFPSERYKKMKQAQREHFESDPRISKTLRKIYAAAKAVESSRNETTSSSSPNHFRTRPQRDRPTNFLVEDESLQPDLYTFSDEVLLFGYSTDEIYYSSYLLKTESSQDTSTSNERFCGVLARNNDVILQNKLMCTNSEDSSAKSFDNKRGSDLERYLLKDIENSGSDPAVLSSVFSTSSLERKVNEIQLNDQKS